jgi:hypothetical protein
MFIKRKHDINITSPEAKEIIKAFKKKEKEYFKNQHHRKLTRRQIKRLILILIIFILMIVTNITISIMLYLHQPKIIEKEIIKLRHITGMNINKELQWHFENGYADVVYDFYEDYIGNRNNTIALVNSALLHGIPLHKSIGQSWTESTHKANAIGYNYYKSGKLRSVDRGIKQGNEYTFPKASPIKMLDPYYNLAWCDAYYRSDYEYFQKINTKLSWNRATISYNRGRSRLDERGLIYLQSVLDYEQYLDEQFNLYFPIIS